MKPYIKDIRLGLFVLLALGASIISSHGAYQFFLYLVDPWLAGVFILVVALGIIGLDVAGTIERGRRAVAYYAGMAFFLVLETLANYFAGQSNFVSKIVEKLPQSSDLRAVAETQPGWTRVLVVLFLSLASLAVAFFAFAATTRFQQVRAGVEGSIVARLSELLRQRRTLIKTIVRALKLERNERKRAGELLRRSAIQAEGYRTELAAARQEATQMAERLRAEFDTERTRHASELARAATQLQIERNHTAIEVSGARQQDAHALSEAHARIEDLQSELLQAEQRYRDLELSISDRVASAKDDMRSHLMRQRVAAAKECKGWVYILRSETGTYKIGRAKDVQSRIASMSGFLPFGVNLVHQIATTNTRRLELRLHRCFADRRIRGEWFTLSESDLDALQSLDSIPDEEIDDTVDILSMVVNVPATLQTPVLDADEPEIVRLKDREGLSFTQIGERLNISRQAAWQQYQTAKRNQEKVEA